VEVDFEYLEKLAIWYFSSGKLSFDASKGLKGFIRNFLMNVLFLCYSKQQLQKECRDTPENFQRHTNVPWHKA
jgi:hypothetical protein